MIARDINYETLLPLEFLDSKCLNSDCVTIDYEKELPPGEYVALVEVDWRTYSQQKRRYIFSTYSQTDKIELSFSSASKNIHTFDYLAEILKSCAKTKSQRKNYSDKGHDNIFRCMSITDSNSEYGYLYYQNDSRCKASLKETVVFNKLENFSVLLEDGDRSTKVELRGPNKNAIEE
jgi:hypothetical protein